jgi:23S rRNA (cytosine1962-C5)-methyltransferase
VKRHARQKNELGDARDSAWAPSAPLQGRAAPEELVVYEHGLPLGVRLGEGLRTGLFLDQRDNRRRIRERAAGKRVLNLFAYSGGFSVAALAGGASEVTSVDASAAALAWAERNCARIGAADRHRTWHADVFEMLARLARKRERFDLIVLDPPSYAKTRHRRFVAQRHYAALCQAVLAVLAPGGSLLACINHRAVSRAKLRRDVRNAAAAGQKRPLDLRVDSRQRPTAPRPPTQFGEARSARGEARTEREGSGGLANGACGRVKAVYDVDY